MSDGLLHAAPGRMVNEAIIAMKRDLGGLSSRRRDFGLALLVAAVTVAGASAVSYLGSMLWVFPQACRVR
jgi:hypothetical protein